MQHSWLPWLPLGGVIRGADGFRVGVFLYLERVYVELRCHDRSCGRKGVAEKYMQVVLEDTRIKVRCAVREVDGFRVGLNSLCESRDQIYVECSQIKLHVTTL